MITIYDPDSQDWSNNGLGVLIPTSCIVKETGGGEYELTITHPLDENSRWQMIQRGFLIKAPVPERETPFIQQSAEARTESPEHIIWEVMAASASVYAKAKSSSKRLKRLKLGAEVIYHEDSDAYSHITTSDGTTGYIAKSSIAYKRTEPYLSAQPAYQTAVPARQIREQIFRIYKVSVDDKNQTVTAQARHIQYDQLGNVVKSYSPSGSDPQAALLAMSADCLNEHDFDYYTNITDAITADWARKNVIEVIHDPDNGIVPKFHAQLVRDNYDTFILKNVERDRGVVIAYGKNMLGITSNVNDEAAVTRIMPIGYDANGAPMLLPELYIDSPFIGDYPTVRAIPFDVQEAKVRAAEGEDPGMTVEQAYTKMREEAQKQFDNGCDLVDLEITVDFIHLGDTVEYAQYKNLQQVFLYDTVTIRHSKLGLLYKTQVIGYEFDAILGRYNKVTLGNIKNGAEIGAIAGFQLPSMGISGNKLVPGSVGSSQLQALSVLNAHIANATIDVAKVKNFIAEVATIALAKIDDAWIDEAWITKLTAEVVDIVLAHIDTLVVNNATINWASISNLTAQIAEIAAAQIGSADISYAKVKDLVAGTAIITEGVGGKLYIDRLAVSEANIVNLTAGKLMVLGTDGAIYRLGVDAGGNVTATLTQVSNSNIANLSLNAGEKLIDSSITARCLNVTEIFANSALIGVIKSAHIGAGEIETTHISAPAKAALTLEARNSIHSAVTNLLPSSKVERTSLATDYMFQAWDVSSKSKETTTYALSVNGRKTGSAKLRVYVYSRVWNGTGYDWSWNTYVDIDTLNDETQSVVFTTPENITNLYVEAYNFPSGNGGTATCNWVVLAEGNIPVADWAPAPEDTAAAIAEAMATITPEQILLWVKDGTLSKIQLSAALALIESDEINFRTLALSILLRDASDDVIALFNEQGLDLSGVLSASAIFAPNVQKVYTGPAAATWKGDPQTTINGIEKYLPYAVTVTIPSGTHYCDLVISDYQGALLTIYFAAGAVIVGSILVQNCKAQVLITAGWGADGHILCTGARGIYFINCASPQLWNMRITGKVRASASVGTSSGLVMEQCNGFMTGYVIVERMTWEAVIISRGSTGQMEYFSGGQAGGDYTSLANLNVGLYVGPGSVVSVSNTIPYGNSAAYYVGGGFAPGIDTATRTGSPGTQPPAPTTRTLRYTQNDSVTYKKSSSGNWVATGGTYVWRSNSTSFGDQLGMWFLGNANSISADIGTGTIQAMRVTLQRSTAYSDSTPVSVPIRMHNYATRDQYGNGTSVRPSMSDVIFTQAFARGEAITIDVPSSYWAAVKAGTYRGFGVLEGYTVRMDAVCVLEIVVQGGP